MEEIPQELWVALSSHTQLILMVAKEVESVFHVERVFTIIRVSAIDSRGMLLLLIAIPRLVT